MKRQLTNIPASVRQRGVGGPIDRAVSGSKGMNPPRGIAVQTAGASKARPLAVASFPAPVCSGFILIFIDNQMERLVQGKRKKKGRLES